jgi:predicted PurR-regulated permease PerM
MHDEPLIHKIRSPNFILSATCLIALLHFGRDFLQPIAIALVLGMALTPLIRFMGKLRLSQSAATVATLVLTVAALLGAGTILAAQLIALATDLPQYRAEIHAKARDLEALAERSVARFPTGLLAPPRPPTPAQKRAARTGELAVPDLAGTLQTPGSAKTSLIKVAGLVSGPLGQAGLVLVLLIFVLLDYENLRERVIRLTGQREVGRTIQALEDAAQGVSRFFFSQILLNLLFGAVVGGILWLLGVPHVPLWAALCAVLRFVPYIGAMIAGAAIVGFCATLAPGWTLAIEALVLFGTLELLMANVVEPRVYGHSSGMSPLAVIVSTLFWSVLWGPVGLLLSTPLTLCLVVAGRYVKGLEILSILLSDSTNASDAQRFYHRVLAGDAEAISRDARAFVRKSSLARYCDLVLLPGLAMAVADVRSSGNIEQPQHVRLRHTIGQVALTLASERSGARGFRRSVPMVNETVGAHLRHRREERLGLWQGSLDLPARSVVLCAALPGERDEFHNELLVLALREAGNDARSIVLTDEPGPRPEAEHLVSTVFMVYPSQELFSNWCTHVGHMRNNLPDVALVSIRLDAAMGFADASAVAPHVDMLLRSFEEALAFVAPLQSTAPA